MKKSMITKQTGDLFGQLWKPFDNDSFEFSVGLFRKRFMANGFDMKWFNGKRCIDVGCGGGRYSIAMAREGAIEVVGLDIGTEGLNDAAERAKDYPQVKFMEGSVLDIPFDKEEFDFVFCSGVLMITEDPERGFEELCRVLRPGGKIYLLLYATGGIRWPAVMEYRQCLRGLAEGDLKKIMEDEGFPPNKIRTLMDDLKVPIIDFFTWEYVCRQLERNRIYNLQRWEKGRFDHEENLEEMIADMQWFRRCFKAGTRLQKYKQVMGKALEICNQYLSAMKILRDLSDSGGIGKETARRIIIGQGHHRVIGDKM